MIKHFLFDLDNTVYPPSTGLMNQLGENIHQFIQEELNTSRDEAVELRKKYLKTYGTTLQGLRENYEIDSDKYISFIHQFSLDGILSEDTELDRILSDITTPKSIFTNSPIEHAENVLNTLNIKNHFQNIYSIRWFNLKGKPDLSSYYKVADNLNVNTDECILLDDYPANLIAARKTNMKTVYVGDKENSFDVDYRIKKIHHLTEILHLIEYL